MHDKNIHLKDKSFLLEKASKQVKENLRRKLSVVSPKVEVTDFRNRVCNQNLSTRVYGGITELRKKVCQTLTLKVLQKTVRLKYNTLRLQCFINISRTIKLTFKKLTKTTKIQKNWKLAGGETRT